MADPAAGPPSSQLRDRRPGARSEAVGEGQPWAQTDCTDFRDVQASGRVLLENALALCIADAYPVSVGHSLVIPRRHVADGMALHQPEWNAVVELLPPLLQQPGRYDQRLDIGLNSGEAAGQTVFHAHCI